MEILEQRVAELRKAVDGQGPFFDAVVLTACDEQQKQTYEAQVSARVASRVLPPQCRYIVVADRPTKDGNRVGCGGATINVLDILRKEFAASEKSFPQDTRVLLIHSGGYSMRNPNLSTTGKIFAPIPCPLVRGFPVCTLFDLKVALMLPFCAQSSGIMMCAGDVVDVFDAACVRVMEIGVTALAHPDNLEYAALHGVFEIDREDAPEGAAERQVYPVAVYHQKPKRDVLERMASADFPSSAQSERGEQVVWTDSDFWMAPDVIGAVCELVKWADAPFGEIDAYGDFLAPLAASAGGGSPEALASRPDLKDAWDALLPLGLHAACPREHVAFYHIGTMGEYVAHLCGNMGELGFADLDRRSGKGARICGSEVSQSSLDAGCAVFSSFLEGCSVGAGSVVEFSHLIGSTVGEGCIVSSVTAEGARIPDGVVLCTIPLEDGCTTTVCFGVQDDMKAVGAAQIAGVKLPRPLESSLYSASIFPVVRGSASDSVRATLDLLEIGLLDGRPERTISLQDAVQSKGKVARVMQRRAPVPGSGLRDHILLSARRRLPAELRGRPACVELPARIVLSGGWSDTPPFCCLYEGKVVNGAVSVGGRLPISATAEPGVVLTLVDGCTGAREEHASLASLVAGGFDPGTSLALHRAVVAVLMDFPQQYACPRVGPDGAVSQAAGVLRDVALPPVTLSTRVDLPRGSGLGTSSILMLACVRALREALGGMAYDFDEETELVLAVEQLMGTGGGWQDQVGGGTLGMKMTTARTGRYEVRKLDWSEAHREHFNGRLICVDTVMTRMAKHTLDDVVGNFMRGSASSVAIVSGELQENAACMFLGFERFAEVDGSRLVDEAGAPSSEVRAALEEIGAQLGAYRDLCARLSGSFLGGLAAVLERVDGFCYGRCNLMGAGNGGYVVGILRHGVDEREVMQSLSQMEGVEVELCKMEVV